MLKRSLAVLLLAGLVAAAAIWMRASRPRDTTTPAPAPSPATYVGAATCRNCHEPEFRAWQTSHHAQAMQVAEEGRVLGNFEEATFKYGDVTSRFFRRDGKYWVRTDAKDGTLQDFEIKYTFGVTPLQQYLIETPGGRLQALSISWDSRPKSDGGQRWFHLYPGERITHTDELHWTGRHQNWNFMCADCHSTNLRKGYDAAADRFETKWSEVNVACEACHGPGSLHAKNPKEKLPARLDERRNVRWDIEPATLTPRRSIARTTSTEIDVCAQCHSRREQIAEGYTPGAPFEDYYAPSFMASRLYHADGQQRDEVYTHASFLQSRMAHAGVTCSDCHDAHSGRTRLPGNGLCAQCHSPAKFDATTHHLHRPASAGAVCVACHMPETTYMVVDPRRDHSIRVPRPDRTVALGVPNACSTCHRDRTPHWAAERLRAHFGRAPGGFQTFAEAFHAGESGHGQHGQHGNDATTADALRRIADDTAQPPIVRASALARLADVPGRVAVDAAARHIRDGDPGVRRAAASIFEILPPDARRAPLAPLLRDPLRSVRLQAAWLLAPASSAIAGTADEDAFTRAADEFVAARRLAADRPEDRTTLGTFFLHLGRRGEAADEFRAALKIWPRYTPARVNLSDLHREEGREVEAERTIREGIAEAPDDPMLHHALGLSLARSGRQTDAIAALKRAADLSADVQFAYTYAVALNSAGRGKEAIATLERALPRAPRDRDALFALATFHRDAGNAQKALAYAERLQQFHPDDPEARALVSSLRSR